MSLRLRESESTIRLRSKTQLGRTVEQRPFGPKREKISKFGRAIIGLWPDKPALNLSQRMRISERNALRIIRGQRKVTARALLVLNAEVLD